MSTLLQLVRLPTKPPAERANRTPRPPNARHPGGRLSAFYGFLRKEFYHILRDRKTLAVLIVMPLVQVLLFGSAIRTDVDNVRLAIVDPDPDAATLELRARFSGTGVFETVAVRRKADGLNDLFQRDVAQQAVVFEPDFAARLTSREGARVLLVTDATEPNMGSAMQAYATAVIRDYERELGAAAPGIRIVPETRMRFNPTLESVNLFVPGLIAFLLTIVCALMSAISLTREKEMGTMEALLVSPLRPWQIVIGKVLPYLALGFADVVLVIAAARLVFGVPLRGSATLLLAESMLFIVTALSLGVLIATRTDSQRVAMIGALAGLMLPTMILSGFIFPVESMPTVLQWVTNIVPAKWYLLIARGIMLKGVGLAFLWQETLILLGMTVVLLVVAAKNFNIRIA